MPTTTFLGVEHAIKLPDGPTSHAVSFELIGGCSPNALRGYSAILGLCVPSLWMPPVPAKRGDPVGAGLAMPFSYRSCGNDAMEFGARCWGVMHAAGVTESEIISAAHPVFEALHARTFPSTVEVKERADFIDASAEP